jgi:hypothetical protein
MFSLARSAISSELVVPSPLTSSSAVCQAEKASSKVQLFSMPTTSPASLKMILTVASMKMCGCAAAGATSASISPNSETKRRRI